MLREALWLDLAQQYLSDTEINIVHKLPYNKWSILKRAIFNYIDLELREAGEIKPPILKDFDSVFVRHFRRSIVIETDKIKTARIILDKQGFIIYLKATDYLARKRAFLAHELGHTYFYDLTVSPPRLLVKQLLNKLQVNPASQYGAEEGLPFDFGREILIPTFLMEKYVPQTPSLEAFFRASKIFSVSKLLMAKRLYWHPHALDLNYWPGSILIYYPDKKIMRGLKDKRFPVPRGPREVYKGKHLKNFSVGKNWDKISLYMPEFLDHPNEIILFPSALLYNRKRLTLEGSFILAKRNKYLYLILREFKEKEKFFYQGKLSIVKSY